ncbi:unnamed protein product [Gongylonema pulchrum]|uniref:Secreted protein n=1 Tax=Gongylonema pulchrum TaxID=637853 RepID=A0A183E759_9BILA|nr:unnamed protein product [Gongylonema pulchrum]
MAGGYYAFSLPAPAADGTISLFLMPLGATNATLMHTKDVHNVSLTISRENKVTELQQTMKVCTK